MSTRPAESQWQRLKRRGPACEAEQDPMWTPVYPEYPTSPINAPGPTGGRMMTRVFQLMYKMKRAMYGLCLLVFAPAVLLGQPGLKLYAYWQTTVPARTVSPDGVRFVYSKNPAESTVIYHVFVKNVSAGAIVIPTFPREGYPSILVSEPKGYNIMLYRFQARYAFGDTGSGQVIDSACAYRPVCLRPGELTELSLWSMIMKPGEKPPQYLVRFEVDEPMAKNYGWWTGIIQAFAAPYSPSSAFGRSSK